MASLELSQKLIDHFKITKVETTKKGGQKKVFIVLIDGVKYAFKIINFADERIEREIKICEKFNSNKGIPSIIKVEQFEEDTIIIEEYIEGNDLTDLINEYKNDSAKVIDLIKQVSYILQPVWEAKYVHRDLKPNNIRIKTNGDPCVLDFGIARALDEESITSAGFQPHTLKFASPEQIEGKKEFISYRTDFFCLGIIGYHLFTGGYPFGSSKEKISSAFKNQNLSVNVTNPKLNIFCNNVLKYHPADRPRNFQSFIKNLES